MKKILLIVLLGLNTMAYGQNLDELLKFIKANPQKASVCLIENGQTIVDFNSQQVMPLASAVKTIIAIEFAQQVAQSKINPNAKVALKELDHYYIPGTDGQAHPNWIRSLGLKQSDSTSLLEVAKGMIKFSSNANTEYLQDLLGLEAINKNIKKLGLKSHQPLYYFTAGAIMACLKPEGKNEQEWIAELKAMPEAAYRTKCETMHRQLKNDITFRQRFSFANLSFAIQQVWSDRLVGATTANYAQLMEHIKNGKTFSPAVQSVLESILEWPMANKANTEIFTHLGQKGGSTSFVLTDAFYANTKKGESLACAFFFNQLNVEEQKLVSNAFGAFEANILINANFRKKLAEFLK